MSPHILAQVPPTLHRFAEVGSRASSDQVPPTALIEGLPNAVRRPPLPGERRTIDLDRDDQLQPLVDPHVSHFRQVPLRTMVNEPHSVQASPV